MKIYLLTKNGSVDYDMAGAFVVAAASPKRARFFAATEAGDEGPDVWLDCERSHCRAIGMATAGVKSGVVVRDFNAG